MDSMLIFAFQTGNDSLATIMVDYDRFIADLLHVGSLLNPHSQSWGVHLGL